MSGETARNAYYALFLHSADALLLTAPDGSILAANPAACRMFGRSEEEICRVGRAGVMDVADPRLAAALSDRDRTGFMDAELSALRSDGTRFPVHVRSTVFTSSDGAQRTAMIVRDLSEQVRLRHEREQYFRFFKLSHDAMCIADPFGKFLHVNDAFVHLTGYSAEELIARPFLDFVLPEDRERTAEEMRLQVATRPSLNFENRYLRKDGAALLLSWTAYFDRSDGVTYAVARDVTAQRAAEARVRRLSGLYEALSRCNSAIVHAADETTLFRDVCSAAVSTGVLKMAWVGLIDEATRGILPVASAGTGTDYLSHITVSAADVPEGRGPSGTAAREGRAVWCRDFLADPRTVPWHAAGAKYGLASSGSLPIRRDGAVIGTLTVYAGVKDAFDADVEALLAEMAGDIGFALDNFARARRAREADEALRHSEARFHTMFDQAPLGIALIDSLDGRILEVNPKFAAIAGRTREEMRRIDWMSITHPDDVQEDLDQMARMNAGEIPGFQMKKRYRLPDGTYVRIRMTIAPLTGRGSRRHLCMIEDITDQERAEARAQQYLKQLETAFMRTVEVAMTLGEMRDPYTAGHEKRVAEIAVAIGAELGLDADRIEGLRVAGYLHDVGKITIPSDILSKPGRLSPAEMALIRTHAASGYEVLKDVGFPWPVAQVALQHHERMDGSGYPNGLKGDAIVLEARITAVADVIEAMASHRPYRAALGIDKALEEIEHGRGAAYDAQVADACLRLFREKRYKLPA